MLNSTRQYVLPGELLTPDLFLKRAKKDTFFKEVNESYRRESLKNPVDTYAIQCEKDWAALGNQIVGAETF